MVKSSDARWRPASDDGTNDRRSVSLAGFAATLFIVVLALLVARKLQVRCLIEDCILAGGSGCQHVAENLRVSRAFEAFADDARRWLVRESRADPDPL
jgi:hypothetical protein